LLLTACVVATTIGPALADDAPEKAPICTGCHGENGVPGDKLTPVIAGQQEGYIYLELRDYKLGNRKNELMQQIAGDLSKSEMEDLAAWFAQQPWPDLGQKAAADDVARHVETINGTAGCSGCHGQDWLGNSAIPRVADQSFDYLRATMLAFKSGERGNNPWMTALLKTYSDADIEAMARYLAGL
jgi:cytochrome c553